MITATPFVRTAVPFDTAVSATLSWCIFGFLTFVGLVTLDLPAAGATYYATITALFGMVFSGLGLLLGELSGTYQTATRLALGIILGPSIFRALIDGITWDLTCPNPMGWPAQTRPWSDPVTWPYLACLFSGLALARGPLRFLGIVTLAQM